MSIVFHLASNFKINHVAVSISMILIAFHDGLINTSHQFDDEEFEVVGERSYYMQNALVSFLIAIKQIYVMTNLFFYSYQSFILMTVFMFLFQEAYLEGHSR